MKAWARKNVVGGFPCQGARIEYCKCAKLIENRFSRRQSCRLHHQACHAPHPILGLALVPFLRRLSYFFFALCIRYKTAITSTATTYFLLYKTYHNHAPTLRLIFCLKLDFFINFSSYQIFSEEKFDTAHTYRDARSTSGRWRATSPWESSVNALILGTRMPIAQGRCWPLLPLLCLDWQTAPLNILSVWSPAPTTTCNIPFAYLYQLYHCIFNIICSALEFDQSKRFVLQIRARVSLLWLPEQFCYIDHWRWHLSNPNMENTHKAKQFRVTTDNFRKREAGGLQVWYSFLTKKGIWQTKLDIMDILHKSGKTKDVLL